MRRRKAMVVQLERFKLNYEASPKPFRPQLREWPRTFVFDRLPEIVVDALMRTIGSVAKVWRLITSRKAVKQQLTKRRARQ